MVVCTTDTCLRCTYSCAERHSQCYSQCYNFGCRLNCDDGMNYCVAACPDLGTEWVDADGTLLGHPLDTPNALAGCGSPVDDLERELPITRAVGNEIWVGVNWLAVSERERQEMANVILKCLDSPELVVHPGPGVSSEVIGRYTRKDPGPHEMVPP